MALQILSSDLSTSFKLAARLKRTGDATNVRRTANCDAVMRVVALATGRALLAAVRKAVDNIRERVRVREWRWDECDFRGQN